MANNTSSQHARANDEPRARFRPPPSDAEDDISSSKSEPRANGRDDADGSKPQSLTGDLRRLPEALAPLVERHCWVLWRWQMSEKGKWTKVPYQPDGRTAKNNDPSTWSSYRTVMRALRNFDGVGFCLMDEDLAAFDVDDCRNPVTGAIHPWAEQLVEKAATYTEITVSGTGLRIIGYGTGSKVHRKQSVADGVTLETYRRAERYIVITGNPLPGADVVIADIDPHIDATVAELDARKDRARGNGNRRERADAKQQREVPPAGHDELDDLIRNGCGDRFDGDRSRAVWFAVNEMLRRGYLPTIIEQTLLDRANGISEHIYDQKSPTEYATRQVTKAVQEIDLSRNEHGQPHKNQNNIRVALLKMGVQLRYDQFAARTLIQGLSGFGPSLVDAAVDRIWLQVEQHFHFQPSKELVRTVVADTAKLNCFHPVRDYLDGVKWDRVKRLDQWLTAYAGAPDTEYTRAVGALVLIAAVRRVRQPGCKFDEMLVLECPEQGTEKSSALAVLAVRKEWFSDQLPLNADGKAVIEALHGHWIIEAAELSGMKRTDIEHLKAFLSRQVDRARMSYDRLVSEVPRQSIVIGTTNSVEYLRDTSGNRRYWPVQVESFDLEALRENRDQLWAEAAAREAEGTSIRLDPKLWSLAERQQEWRLTQDPWHQLLSDKLGEYEQAKISTESIWTILDIKPAQRGQEQSRRVGEAMRKLGWDRANSGGTVKIDGKLVSGYVIGRKPRPTVEAIRDCDGLYVRLAEDEEDGS